MKISSNTTIGAIIKANPLALDAIVGLSPKFKKLYNPLLRKLMAKRTSVASAARIGKVETAEFFRVLKPLGFEIEEENATVFKNYTVLPPFLSNIPLENRIYFDARPLLASDKDPLKEILEQVKKLSTEKVLIIQNTFEPIPLITLLKKKNFEAFVLKENDDYYETWFYKSNTPAVKPAAGDEPNLTAFNWEKLLEVYAGKMVTIDVRNLPMPQPMIKILETLNTLDSSKALYVYHKKVPVYLLQELADREYGYSIKEYDNGGVDLLIFKK